VQLQEARRSAPDDAAAAQDRPAGLRTAYGIGVVTAPAGPAEAACCPQGQRLEALARAESDLSAAVDYLVLARRHPGHRENPLAREEQSR
jgi:hypothetical protein